MLINQDAFLKRIALFLSILLLFNLPAFSQSEKLVTVNVTDETLEETLKLIENQTGLAFSYNPKKIPVDQRISYRCEDKELDQVLQDLQNQLNLNFERIEEQIVILPIKKKDAEKIPEFTISGYVRDSTSGETLIGTTIIVEETGTGVITNPYGFYSMTLPEGDYTIRYSFIGFKPIRQKVNLSSNRELSFDLVENAPMLPEIIVNSKRIKMVGEVQMGRIHLRPEEVKEIPALFGEPDVIKSLQLIPGIKLHSDGSTFFHVRGGDRDQNLILVDEAPIFNPSHLLGFFSTMIPEAVKDVNVYKTDIPSSKGGRLSSVVDVRTKEGNLKKFQAWGSLGLASSKFGVEGPFKKDKSSYFLSGRFSRVKWLVDSEIPDLDQFYFLDLNGKMNFQLNKNNRLYTSFYSGNDFYDLDNNTGINWANNSLTVRWNHLFNDRLFMNTTMHTSKYDYFFITNAAINEQWNSHIANFTIKSDFAFFKRPTNQISFGLMIGHNNFNPGNIESDTLIGTPPPVVSRKNADEVVLYVEQERKLGKKWGLKYGLRFGLWSTTAVEGGFELLFNETRNVGDTVFYNEGEVYHQELYAEPRFNISYFPSENSSLKMSYNRTVQNIHLISNSISPFTSLEVWLPTSINIRPQFADQLSLGYYKEFENTGVSLETEVYVKDMQNQIDYVDHAEMLLNPAIEGELEIGKANAYGFEVLARKEEGRIRGWVGYTLSRVEKQFPGINGGQPFPAFYDRPHELNIHTSYDLKERLTIGANWTISTGAAFTSPSGFYFYDGQQVPVYESRNNDRFPTYHRLDFLLDYQLNKEVRKFKHGISFGLFNVYGRNNSIFYNFNKRPDGEGGFVTPGNLFNPTRLTTHTYLYEVVPSISYNFKFL